MGYVNAIIHTNNPPQELFPSFVGEYNVLLWFKFSVIHMHQNLVRNCSIDKRFVSTFQQPSAAVGNRRMHVAVKVKISPIFSIYYTISNRSSLKLCVSVNIETNPSKIPEYPSK